MALRAPDAALDHPLRQRRITRGEFARLLVRERREIERRQRAAARPRAPGGVDGIFVRPRRQHEQGRLRRDGRREFPEPRRFLAAGVVQVLDDEQERRFRAGRLDQPPHDFHAPMLQSLRIQIALDRDLVRRKRRAGQAARVQDPVGGQAARLDRLRNRAAALGGTRLRAEPEQAREQRGQRPARLHLAEVEHLHAMAFRAPRARGFRERLEQARLADAGIAARDDRAAAARRDAALEQRSHERELRVPAREGQVPHAERAPQALGELDLAGMRAPRERLRIRHRVAGERKRAVDARRQERALRDARGRRAGGQLARAKRLHQRLRGAHRPLRLVAREFLQAEHGVQAVTREAIRDAAVQGDRLIEQPLQFLRLLARLLRVERAALGGEARQAQRQHDAGLQHAIVRRRGLRSLRCEINGSRVFRFGAGQGVQRATRTGAALLHQLAIQRLRRRIRREVELTAQHRAAKLVLAERLRVTPGARIAAHEFAVRAFLERLDREQPVERVDFPVGVVRVAAERGEARRGRRKIAPQAPALGGDPFLEGAGMRVEALEQRLCAQCARRLQRRHGRLREQGAKAMDVHLHLREVQRDLLRIGLEQRVEFRRQRAAQRRQRLAQARAREFGVGVFPEERGQALAALPRPVLEREKGEQGAGLTGRDLERPVTRAPEFEASEQSQAQHRPRRLP